MNAFPFLGYLVVESQVLQSKDFDEYAALTQSGYLVIHELSCQLSILDIHLQIIQNGSYFIKAWAISDILETYFKRLEKDMS